ncbi:MAG: HAMP domain-containing histidine kinase [Firmicutes bacterium]|uniref:histidine kinase n=1 Tax=Candidatus Stercoripulliclostridium pullicola TaxID=2840953 RepID=A0A940DFN4_9FIRM|nr:HAMP domain-containing histidine kinase [Candidatus Stercoripulliclostridium pullicola]
MPRSARFSWGDAPLKHKLIVAFVVAVILLFVFLWIFDLIFLDTVYESIALRDLKNCVETVSENIASEDLNILIKHLAYHDNACVLVCDADGNELYSQAVRTDCTIHNISAENRIAYFDKVKENDGIYKEEIELEGFNDNYEHTEFEGDVPGDAAGGVKAAVYACVAEKDGAEVLILAEAVVTPEESTRVTWIAMLGIITGMLLLLAALLAAAIARYVARPIAKLTDAAKEISKGNADITISEGGGYREINELKEGLQYAANEVAELEHYRRELIANVSHDLRTPLTLIKGYAEMMRDIPDEARPENLQVVIDEASRLTNLVNEMLDLSKLQESGGGLKLKRFDAVRMLDDLVARHGKLIEHLGYKLEYEHEESAVVYADETKLMQVIYNLINNAINYCGDDKTVTVKEYTRHGNVRIEVIDKGEGIDVNVLPHIWDRYYKSEKSHRRATVGTGLGLSIVKTVMDKHPGGVYGVVTSVGEGSTFYVELPKC